MVLDIPRDVFFMPLPASVSAVRVEGDRYGVQYINRERPPVSDTAMQSTQAPELAFTGR
jgi:hypothetical protein